MVTVAEQITGPQQSGGGTVAQQVGQTPLERRREQQAAQREYEKQQAEYQRAVQQEQQAEAQRLEQLESELARVEEGIEREEAQARIRLKRGYA